MASVDNTKSQRSFKTPNYWAALASCYILLSLSIAVRLAWIMPHGNEPHPTELPSDGYLSILYAGPGHVRNHCLIRCTVFLIRQQKEYYVTIDLPK